MLMTLDLHLFYLINQLPHTALLDFCAVVIDRVTIGSIIYYPFIIWLIISKDIRNKFIAGIWIMVIITTAVCNDLILKNVVRRLRPFQSLSHVITVHPIPSSFSFPSGQSAAAWATALFLIYVLPKGKAKYLLFIFAIIVGIDRIYMGHHYPSDVVAGAIFGSIIAYLYAKYKNPVERALNVIFSR